MPVSLPTPDQLKRIAEKMNLSLSEADVASFLALMKPSIDGYNVVDQLPEEGFGLVESAVVERFARPLERRRVAGVGHPSLVSPGVWPRPAPGAGTTSRPSSRTPTRPGRTRRRRRSDAGCGHAARPSPRGPTMGPTCS